jgi:hypothetical protein
MANTSKMCSNWCTKKAETATRQRKHLPRHHRITAVVRRVGFAFFLKRDEDDTVKGHHIIIIILLLLCQAIPCRSFSPLLRCRSNERTPKKHALSVSLLPLPLSWTRRNDEPWRNASVGRGHGSSG